MSSNEANNGDDLSHLTQQSALELLNSYPGQEWRPLYSFTTPGGLLAGGINQTTPVSRQKASKASIEAMPKVTVAYEDGTECSICLNGFKVGDEFKEIPCKHSFHGACIEKWMGMSTHCPLCRFALPAESEDEQNSDNNNNNYYYYTIVNEYVRSILDPVDYGSDIEYDSETEEDAGGEWDTRTVDVDNENTLGFTFRFSLDINDEDPKNEPHNVGDADELIDEDA